MKKPVPDNLVSGSLASGPPFGGCSRTQVTTARMAGALSFMSTVVNTVLSFLISTLDASATLFMNSTDASVVDRILLPPSPDIENVYGQGLVVGQSVTSDNRISFLFPIQAFHLGLEIKIALALSVALWIWTI